MLPGPIHFDKLVAGVLARKSAQTADSLAMSPVANLLLKRSDSRSKSVQNH